MINNALAKKLIIDARIKINTPIIVGFSGGPDSLTLLHLLNDLGYSTIAAHSDHGLRIESAEEAQQAAHAAKELGIPLFSEALDIRGYAVRTKLSLEEAARELRYRFLFRLAGEEGAQAVAVAHTADDQVETMLMHLLRGAGSAGLRGMQTWLLPNPWSATIPLVRPLLRIWREDVEEYIQRYGLVPVRDPSNRDQTFFRNRLRLEAIPYLETLVPGIKKRLYQTSELAAEEYALVAELVDQAWKRTLVLKGKDYLAFSRDRFQAEPIALQRGLLRRSFAYLKPGERDLDFQSVQRGLDFVESPSSSEEWDWLAGTVLLVEGEMVWIAVGNANLPHPWPQAPDHDMHIEVPADLELSQGWRLVLRQRAAPDIALINADPYRGWLAADRAGDEFIVRRRKLGDRFRPLGLRKGWAKLSDFMINQKMPRRARDAWPLLCKGEEIVWIPGYQISDEYRLRGRARAALEVRLMRPEDA